MGQIERYAMIYITGAGCYHPDMLTIGAMKVLQKADCVLYDHLINMEFLRYTKKSCECICVGKRGHGTSTQQKDIMELLVLKNKQYKVVVRLKGGDPYLYGRGSEEMAYCLERGIACQYIPGIPSAVGGLGFAGIPVTERGVSSGFHVHTLHYRDGVDHLDYKAIVSSHETEIFFMGSTKVFQLVQKCLENGMDEHTPITLASHLTMPDQKVLVSTLAEIQRETISLFSSPMLIVLGNTAKRQKQLDNTAYLPHYGKKILLTSIDDAPWPINYLTLETGIFVEERQVAEIIYCPKNFKKPDGYDGLLFVSRHSVEAWFSALELHKEDARSLYGKTICCIGNKTAAALMEKGILADHIYTNRRDFFSYRTKDNILWIGGTDTKLPVKMDICGCYAIKELPFKIDSHYDAAAATCPFSILQLKAHGLPLSTPLFTFENRTYDAAIEAGFEDVHACHNSKEAITQEIVRFFGEEKDESRT